MSCHKTDHRVTNTLEQTVLLYKSLAQWKTLEKEKEKEKVNGQTLPKNTCIGNLKGKAKGKAKNMP